MPAHPATTSAVRAHGERMRCYGFHHRDRVVSVPQQQEHSRLCAPETRTTTAPNRGGSLLASCRRRMVDAARHGCDDAWKQRGGTTREHAAATERTEERSDRMTPHCLQLAVPSETELLTPTAVRERLEHQSVLLRLTVHELRRPLTVIDGWISMIRDGSVGPPLESRQAEQGLAVMAGAVREMAALLDGLAAVAMNDDRGGVLRRQHCRLRRVIASALAAVEHEARAHKVVVAQNGADVEAELDPDRLRIALVNLISNAIRYSPAGSTVEVATRPAADEVTITVSDHGPGILPADVEHIFEPWYQSSDASSGLGLWLWIVRRIVEWHRGRVTVESAPGHGSTFSVVLPLGESGIPAAGPTRHVG